MITCGTARKNCLLTFFPVKKYWRKVSSWLFSWWSGTYSYVLRAIFPDMWYLTPKNIVKTKTPQPHRVCFFVKKSSTY